eukprot:8807776-Pyramimonas_sp.AAC.1
MSKLRRCPLSSTHSQNEDMVQPSLYRVILRALRGPETLAQGQSSLEKTTLQSLPQKPKGEGPSKLSTL